MKRILLSLGTIAVVGAAVVGGTGAFFQDTETSTGNIFVAGAIDLKVDHTLATYNDFICQDGAWVSSGSAIWEQVWQIGDVDAPLDNPYDEFNYSGPVDVAGYSESFTTPFVVGTTPTDEWPWNSDASWSYATDLDIDFDYGGPIPVTARLVIGWSPGKSGSEVNEVRVDYDSTPIGSLVRSGGTNNAFWDGYPRYEDTITFTVTSGSHTLNLLQTQGNGILWDYVRLEILPGSVGTCNLFEEQDLDGSSFFTFGDIKPADEGTNVISLHVFDNDAYACLFTHDIDDQDNSLAEPEVSLGDDLTTGELSGEIEFFGWNDENGNGTYENTEEVLIDAGTPLADVPTEMIALSLTGDGPVDYVGLAWCAGDQTGPTTASPTIPLDCDGNGMGNIAQTDSVAASLTAYAVQQRNNDGFTCEAAFSELFPTIFALTSQDGEHDDNQANNEPYVTWVINGDEIEFTFHNPTSIGSPFPFEYRIDDEPGSPIGGITGVTIPSGPYAGDVWGDFYNFVNVPANSSTTLTLTGSSKIQVRLVIGPERDYDFDWITFETI